MRLIRDLQRKSFLLFVATLPLLAAVGCSSTGTNFARWFNGSPDPETLPAIIEPRVFLGGEALAKKKERMRRVHADLVHLVRGYEKLERQRKRADQQQLAGFIKPYIETQAEPLIAREDEAWNPDLRLLEANLLFAEGALFAALGEAARLGGVVESLEGRFEGYESLLIEYPVGETQTLEDGIADLRAARALL